MPVINRFVLALFLAVTGMPAYAELAEINVAQQYGVSFLPLMVMERDKLVEKHAKAAGLSDVKVNWVKVAGPSVMNDGVISGAIQFIAVGAPSLITLWDKTQSNVQVKGLSAMTTYPLYLNVRNPSIKSIRDFSDKDKIAVPSIKVSTQAIMLQMAAAKEFGDAKYNALDHLTVSMSHPDATAAMLGGQSEITANFSSAPFQYRQMKNPNVKLLLNSKDLFLDDPMSFNIVAATSKFRADNPKLYAAFVAGMKEATDIINADKRKGAEIYLKSTGEKTSVDDIMDVLADKDIIYNNKVGGIRTFVNFMSKTGTLKNPPADWKDMFFPEAMAGVGG